MRRGKAEAAPIAGVKDFRLAGRAAAPDRPDRVDDITGRETVAAGDARLPGRAAAEGAAFLEQAGARGAVDRTVDAAPAEETRIGGVDDRVERQSGDVGGDCPPGGHRGESRKRRIHAATLSRSLGWSRVAIASSGRGRRSRRSSISALAKAGENSGWHWKEMAGWSS